jgi:hypothetical protein
MTGEQEKLVDELIESYREQLDLYKQLNALGQRILGQVVLSRGNISAVMSLFSEKQRILQHIEDRRNAAAPSSRQWQDMKDSIEPCDQTRMLDQLLGEAQSAIGAFLSDEDQLKRYLEHMMQTREAAGQ